MSDIPFGTTDWTKIERTEHKGERGIGLLADATFREHPRSHG
jgi:hypothetical protein